MLRFDKDATFFFFTLKWAEIDPGATTTFA